MLGVALLAPSASRAEPVPVAHSEGLAHGFLVLRSMEGTTLGDGDLIQTSNGHRVTTRLVIRFKDGSTREETTVYTQRREFRLVSNHVVEQTREILRNKVQRDEWAETNYKLGLKYFSYAVAQRKLAARHRGRVQRWSALGGDARTRSDDPNRLALEWLARLLGPRRFDGTSACADCVRGARGWYDRRGHRDRRRREDG